MIFSQSFTGQKCPNQPTKVKRRERASSGLDLSLDQGLAHKLLKGHSLFARSTFFTAACDLIRYKNPKSYVFQNHHPPTQELVQTRSRQSCRTWRGRETCRA